MNWDESPRYCRVLHKLHMSQWLHEAKTKPLQFCVYSRSSRVSESFWLTSSCLQQRMSLCPSCNKEKQDAVGRMRIELFCMHARCPHDVHVSVDISECTVYCIVVSKTEVRRFHLISYFANTAHLLSQLCLCKRKYSPCRSHRLHSVIASNTLRFEEELTHRTQTK